MSFLIVISTLCLRGGVQREMGGLSSRTMEQHKGIGLSAMHGTEHKLRKLCKLRQTIQSRQYKTLGGQCIYKKRHYTTDMIRNNTCKCVSLVCPPKDLLWLAVVKLLSVQSKMNNRGTTSYNITSTHVNMHECADAHTHACKQVGRWRSSKLVRHEDTHLQQIPIPLHTNTRKATLALVPTRTHNPHLVSRLPCILLLSLSLTPPLYSNLS